ncbi:MAG TPA: VOC family protein [Actinophytocola sp.]|uniref:VOC family protein n=1 Tax=Actinophytocola sp. TaxID=1872138 RepID=UPI002DB5EF40|nr:VOC family protein [Actinophytocola sp.]HEU5476102.1 VOC family protein [Actinophytocola sp.]
MTAAATLGMIGIDCADPHAMAEFYHRILGWKIMGDQDDFAMIQGEGVPIVFWKVAGHQAPTWPDSASPKQFHLDLMVDDLDEAEARCLEAGATKADHQPGTHWRVLLDPAGHPFCITHPS